MIWKNVIANSNLIQAESNNAVLIKLPKFDFKFWYPRKLIKTSGKNNYRMTISYTDEFVFNVFKTGNGKYNRFDKIEENTLTSLEFEAYFNDCED